MFGKNKIFSTLVGLGFLFASILSSALATEVEIPLSEETPKSQFQKIEQPISLKLAVVLGGLGLISAELWWFMFSHPNSQHLKMASSDQVNKTKS